MKQKFTNIRYGSSTPVPLCGISKSNVCTNTIFNLDVIPDDFIDDPVFKSDLKKKTLYPGELVGSENIYVNIDFVKSGAKSVKYHSHSLQEEFFLILEGKGNVKINNEKFSVKKGDFFAKPAGKGIKP